MTDTEQAQIPTEGDTTQVANSEDTTSTESPAENNDADDGQTTEGQQDANTQDDTDKNTPFHEHPRWKEREDAWETRFNAQETRHQEDMRKLRDELSPTQKAEVTQTPKIPSWFGGTQEQWDEFRTWNQQQLEATQEGAVTKVTEKQTAEQKRVTEATEYMQSEMTAIEKDKAINPTGAKIDPNKLLQFVLENDLVDSKGRWNYRAGFKLMQAGKTTPPKPPTTEKKNVAAATTSENRAESKPAPYKTSKDFKKKRPW